MEKNKKRASKKSNFTKAGNEKKPLFDKFDNEKFVDDIPMEDLKLDQKDERYETKTKNDSESERKYKADD